MELFRSTKGEMMTAVQQRMYGMFSGVGGFTQFGAVSQVLHGFEYMSGSQSLNCNRCGKYGLG